MIVATTTGTLPESLLIVALVAVFIGGLLILGGLAVGIHWVATARKRRERAARWAGLSEEARQAARIWAMLAEVADPHVPDVCTEPGCLYEIDCGSGGLALYLDHLTTEHPTGGKP